MCIEDMDNFITALFVRVKTKQKFLVTQMSIGRKMNKQIRIFFPIYY